LNCLAAHLRYAEQGAQLSLGVADGIVCVQMSASVNIVFYLHNLQTSTYRHALSITSKQFAVKCLGTVNIPI